VLGATALVCAAAVAVVYMRRRARSAVVSSIPTSERALFATSAKQNPPGSGDGAGFKLNPALSFGAASSQSHVRNLPGVGLSTRSLTAPPANGGGLSTRSLAAPPVSGGLSTRSITAPHVNGSGSGRAILPPVYVRRLDV